MNLAQALQASGQELDQRLRAALELCSSRRVTDSHVFLALCRLNSLPTRILDLDESRLARLPTAHHLNDYITVKRVPFDRIEVVDDALWERVLKLAASLSTVATGHFLRVLIETCLEGGNDYDTRPWTVDTLVWLAGHDESTPLARVPAVARLLDRLRSSPDPCEDFQYVLALESGHLVFRVVSVLDDYVQRSSSGLLIPERALLLHFKDQFGGFTDDEISELEDLLNSSESSEGKFQEYFERHPHFFRRWDYREVHPQVYLTRTSDGELIPDFILTDRELQRAAIVELKLPAPMLVRRQKNRDRVTSAVMEARAQLLRYRDWFRVDSNRNNLKARVGMQVYEPHLSVVIGRSSEFVDEIDRQRLSADNPDLEIVTYDDILTFAKRRRMIIV